MSGVPDKQGAPPSPSRRQLSWRKKLVFSLFTTVLFFGALEGVLALVGVRPATDTSDPFVGFAGNSPLFTPDPADPSRMVTAPGKLAFFNKQGFSRRKADGAKRIFCLGGSTTYGRPYDERTSFSGWLAELLPRVAPDENWEVVNVGGVSYASYRAARLTEELMDYDPDLLIVYTGQNEFLEERTYGDVKRMPALQRDVTAALARTRTYALAQRLLGRGSAPRSADRFELPEEVDAVLDHTVGPTSYERNDEQRRRILEHFESNLARIVQLARRGGAEVLLVTPASNLKDCSPFKSQHSDDLFDERLRNWNRLYEQARKLARDGKLEDSLGAYRRAEKIDARYAELHWRMGRVLLKLQRFDEAQAAFTRAVDEDVCSLRAVSEIPQIIRRTGDRLNVPVADFEQIVGDRCRRQLGHSSPGEEFFLDHVHPTIAANGRLAMVLVERLIEAKIVKGRSRPIEELLDQVSERINSRIDARQHAIALRNLAKVFNWAGKHLEAGSLAMRAVRQAPDDPESLVLSAAYLTETGRGDQAVENYRRALRLRPDYADARRLLGAALVDRGRLNEALEHFTVLARLRPDDARAWQMIGAIHAEQRRFDDALPNYEKAVDLNPNDADIRYNLANALGHLGRRGEAVKHYRRAVAINPNDSDARNNLGVMLMQEGLMDEAADQFRHVLRIRPDDKIAEANLRDAERD
ncbi:MAG: tetratricopeptide repeat protein [Planctomycetales bacterium]